jgi:hypothetical protein
MKAILALKAMLVGCSYCGRCHGEVPYPSDTCPHCGAGSDQLRLMSPISYSLIAIAAATVALAYGAYRWLLAG